MQRINVPLSRTSRLFSSQSVRWKKIGLRAGVFRIQHSRSLATTPESQSIDFYVGLGGIAAIVAGVFWLTDQLFHEPSVREKEKQRVVILGSGWGGVSCASELDPNRFEIIVVSPRSYFLFTPLLSSFTMGKVELGNIIEPLRNFFSRNNLNVTYYEANANSVDPQKKIVKCKTTDGSSTFDLSYDKLVIAVGTTSNRYGVKGVNENCNFLKQIEDAKNIKNKILSNFESANLPGTSEIVQKKLLTFVVVGGHVTSVQFISELYAFVKDIKNSFPNLKDKVDIHFVNMDKGKYKNTYDAKITAYSRDHELVPIKNKISMTEDRILSVDKDGVVFEGRKEKLPYGICVWMGENVPLPMVTELQAKNLKSQTNKNGLLTDEWLKVKGFKDIYAIGECSTVDQKLLVHKWMQIFDELDENRDGVVDEKEFKKLCKNYSRKYPQLIEYSEKAHRLFQEADVNKDGLLQMHEFQSIMQKVDSSVTSLPSTAQVAQQQGRYLANALNHTLRERQLRALFKELDTDHSGNLDEQEIRKGLRTLHLPSSRRAVQEFIASSDVNKDGKINEEEFIKFALETQQQGGTGDWKKLSHSKIFPFRYKHLGGFEYVGYSSSVTERGSLGKSILDGFGAWWLWNSVYVTNLWSNWHRMMTGANFVQRKVEGRSLSKLDL